MKKKKILRAWLVATCYVALAALFLYLLELKDGFIENKGLRLYLYMVVVLGGVWIGTISTIRIMRQKEFVKTPMQINHSTSFSPAVRKHPTSIEAKGVAEYRYFINMAAEHSDYPLLHLPHGVVYEDICQGWRARYAGYDYYIWDRVGNKILLATGDSVHEKKGFRREFSNGNLYKVINKEEAEEIYYLVTSAVYKGLDCGLSALKQKGDDKVRLTSNISDTVSEEDLFQRGFEKKEEGHHGHNYIVYDNMVDRGDSDLDILSKRLEHSPYESNRKEEVINTREDMVRFLAEKISIPSPHIYMNRVLLGTQGYAIPGTSLSTDMEAVMNEVIPRAFELHTKNIDKSSDGFQRVAESFWKNVTNGIYSIEFADRYKNVCWITDKNELIFRRDYKQYCIYMKLNYYDMLFQRKKNAEYPYTYANTDNVEYWLNHEAEGWMGMGGSIYWGDTLVRHGFVGFIYEKFKKFNKEYGMNIKLGGTYGKNIRDN